MGQNKISGVYKITNNITGDFYIGSSKNIKNRWNIHKAPYTIKRYPNVKLYKAMTQYGRDNFTVDVIEETDNLREREQYWIEYLKPAYNDRYADGYNIERCKETSRRHKKEYYEIHRDERLAYSKAYRQAHRDNNRLCLYEGETLTLGALKSRFQRRGIPHAWTEAKKYLIERSL